MQEYCSIVSSTRFENSQLQHLPGTHRHYSFTIQASSSCRLQTPISYGNGSAQFEAITKNNYSLSISYVKWSVFTIIPRLLSTVNVLV